MSRYSVVAVASLPPPIAGQSVATQVLEHGLVDHGVEHQIVDLSRSFHTSSWRRAFDVAQLPRRVWAAARDLSGSIVFYLQLGHSVRAMLRDIPLLALARARGWPAVVHVHGGGFREVYDSAPLAVRAALGPLLGSVARAVVLSDSLAPMFDGLVPDDRVAVVANGTLPEISAAARALEREPPRGTGLRVLYLSNLIEDKGYPLVLEAARLTDDHRFVIAGASTEWQETDPAEFVQRHGLTNVDVRGPVSGADKIDLLSRSDVLVLPTSMNEGQPIALLEAMQLGLPVITTRRGGIPDIVGERNGELIEPGDLRGLMGAIERLSALQRWTECSEHNRVEALERYDHRRHGDAMIEIFSSASR